MKCPCGCESGATRRPTSHRRRLRSLPPQPRHDYSKNDTMTTKTNSLRPSTTHLRRCMSSLSIVLVLLGGVTNAFAADLLFSAEKMALIAGKPHFIIGLYEHIKDDAVLRDAAAAGINLMQCPPDQSALDRVQGAGVRAWINLGGGLNLSGDIEAKRSQLLETVNRFKDHPALLVWEGPDEPLWNVSYSVDNYLRTTEFPAMDAAAKTADDSQREIRALIDRCRNHFQRAQWVEFERLRDEVWERLGKQPPRSKAPLSTALKRCAGFRGWSHPWIRSRAAGGSESYSLAQSCPAQQHRIAASLQPRRGHGRL